MRYILVIVTFCSCSQQVATFGHRHKICYLNITVHNIVKVLSPIRKNFTLLLLNVFVSSELRSLIWTNAFFENQIFKADICEPTDELVQATIKPVIEPHPSLDPKVKEILKKFVNPSTQSVPHIQFVVYMFLCVFCFNVYVVNQKDHHDW